MVRVPRDVLDRLAADPLPVDAVADEAIDALRESGATITESEGFYQLVDLPYGGASVALALDAPYEVEWRDAVESTNRLARELAATGERDVLVLAGEQTRGRGRRDRDWTSPPGGVWMSILTTPTLRPRDRPLATLAAAVAVVDAAASIGVQTEIKWPNDVLLRSTGAKVAGVLTETGGDKNDWLIIGIGINADIPEETVPTGAGTLRDDGERVDRTALASTVVETVDELRVDPPRIRRKWRRYADTIGKRVRVETESGAIVGEAIDITDSGSLVLETGGGQRTVSTGECKHLRET